MNRCGQLQDRTAMENNNRPLSPHLQVYKLPLTGIISITHRMTGVFLSIGLLLFVWSLTTINDGPEAFSQMQSLINFIPVKIFLWIIVYSLFFHLCHGVRHLIWDTGSSFDLEMMDRYASYELADRKSVV